MKAGARSGSRAARSVRPSTTKRSASARSARRPATGRRRPARAAGAAIPRIPARLRIGGAQRLGDLRVARRLGAHLEQQRDAHRSRARPSTIARRPATRPSTICSRRLQLPDQRALFLELALHDREHDRVLVLEVAVDQARAHLRGLGDARHARRVEAVLDEALERGAQDAVALRVGAAAGEPAGSVDLIASLSRQPPPSTL